MSTNTDIFNVVDLEATCWRGERPSTQKQEIIEIGIAQIETQTHDIARTESILIEPIVSEVSDFCTELTSITPEMLDEKGITYEAACQKLREEYQTHEYPWGSWGNWDKSQFYKDCNIKDASMPMNNTHFNIKTLFALSDKRASEVGLGKACDIVFGGFDGDHHRGIDDARNIARVFLNIVGGKDANRSNR